MEDKTFFKIMFILSILVIIFNITDLITTYIALKIPGTYETNPSMAWLIMKLGVWAYIIKLCITYIVLQVKYCPYYHILKFIMNGATGNVRIRCITLFIAAYSFLIIYLASISINNLMIII